MLQLPIVLSVLLLLQPNDVYMQQGIINCY